MKLGLYQHYKGKYYRVIGVSRHSETLEELVVYQALYGGFGLWVRPLKMFLEQISHGGQIVDRFAFVEELFTKGPDITQTQAHHR